MIGLPVTGNRRGHALTLGVELPYPILELPHVILIRVGSAPHESLELGPIGLYLRLDPAHIPLDRANLDVQGPVLGGGLLRGDCGYADRLGERERAVCLVEARRNRLLLLLRQETEVELASLGDGPA